jgi:hypothetical protein
MVAEKMKALTNKAKDDKRTADVNVNYAYAKVITDRKFVKQAKKGLSSCEFKIDRGYSPTLVAEALIELGYETQRKCINGKQYIVAKW